MSSRIALIACLSITLALAVRANWGAETGGVAAPESAQPVQATAGTNSDRRADLLPDGRGTDLNVSNTSNPLSPLSRSQLVVLRNGEMLSGTVTRQADRYIVVRDGSELRLPARDVDFLCQSPDEAYTVLQRRVIAGRIEDHLNLADWCLRQNLLGDAAREIMAGMTLDPKNPRLALLDARLQRALAPASQTVAAATTEEPQPQQKQAVSSQELERIMKTLPAGSVDTFTGKIEPILLNTCATAGCHGPSATSSYVLFKPVFDKTSQRRLTQRNLYNTLQFIDREKPSESKLLAAAREPHGDQKLTATGFDTVKYQELVGWVWQTTRNTNLAAARSIGTKTAGNGLATVSGTQPLPPVAAPFTPLFSQSLNPPTAPSSNPQMVGGRIEPQKGRKLPTAGLKPTGPNASAGGNLNASGNLNPNAVQKPANNQEIPDAASVLGPLSNVQP